MSFSKKNIIAGSALTSAPVQFLSPGHKMTFVGGQIQKERRAEAMRRMNKIEKELMVRLNKIIETGDYETGISYALGSGRTTFIDKSLQSVVDEYGDLAYIQNERMIGVGRIKKILIY